MSTTADNMPSDRHSKTSLAKIFSQVPLLGWLLGGLIAVFLESFFGKDLVQLLDIHNKEPYLFGLDIIVKTIKKMWILLSKHGIAEFLSVIEWDLIWKIPGAIIYCFLIYIFPIGFIARLTAPITNSIARQLFNLPIVISVIFHLLILYFILHIWADISPSRDLFAKLTLVAVIMTLSLNVINGYMGEFSCSHPGFMALGAYGSSIFTLVLFVDDRVFGKAILPPEFGPFFFPIALVIGGIVAAIGALLVAIPSFRTRGDYLAIISLAFMFIVNSFVVNFDGIGGAFGLSKQPEWANLPVVFICTIACIWIINNFVTSTMGKALNTIRDNEMAASAMTINTKRTKILAFLFAAFWAGVAGGLFAHTYGYINPNDFHIKNLAEVLAMVYLGGLNSVYGSLVGAFSISILSEALQPMELLKWIFIPLLLILVMIYRPKGLIAFKEFNIRDLIRPKQKSGKEV